MLGLGLSLAKPIYSFKKRDISDIQVDNLIRWYKFQEGIGLNGTAVKQWNNQVDIANTYLRENNAAFQPDYNDGHLDFIPTDRLTMPTAMNLDEFTIMFCLKLDALSNETIWGSNLSAQHFIRFAQGNVTNQIRIRAGGTGTGQQINTTISQHFNTNRAIYTISRNSDKRTSMYINKTQVLTNDPKLTETLILTRVAVQAGTAAPTDGTISEIAIWENDLTKSEREEAIDIIAARCSVTI